MRLLTDNPIISLLKITATQNEAALIYHSVRGLYFLAVIFAATALLSLILNILQRHYLC